MAEGKSKLTKDEDDYNDEKCLISKKKFPRYGSSNCSETSQPESSYLDSYPEFFIKHPVIQKDTLNSISLKYNLKASKIKRVNRLWSDNIFLCKYLLIPITNIGDYNKNDYNIVLKKDVMLSISKSKSVGSFEPLKNNFSALHNNHNPHLSAIKCEEEESFENVDCLRDINEISPQDYFKKFDSSLAKIKKNVDKLENQNRSQFI